MTTIEASEVHPEHSATMEIPSLTSENVDTNTPPIPSENPEVTTEDPKVAALQAMFPDFDATILHTVLESVSGDQDRAIDVLLGMSDPSYQSTARPDVTQTDLDEEFARNLMLEEQSRQQPAWRARYPNDPPASQPQSSPTNDSVAQIQEQLGKFAESSKRTIGSLFSRVKAKIQELDNSSNESPRNGSRQTVTRQSPPQPAFQPSQVTSEYTRPAPGNEPYDTHVTPVEGYSTEPPATSLNPSAIGLLPRRPVALNSSPQPSSAGAADDDELEYVTNPFEESERK